MTKAKEAQAAIESYARQYRADLRRLGHTESTEGELSRLVLDWLDALDSGGLGPVNCVDCRATNYPKTAGVWECSNCGVENDGS